MNGAAKLEEMLKRMGLDAASLPRARYGCQCFKCKLLEAGLQKAKEWRR